MRSASEYRRHAKDCRDLAKGFTGDRRRQTLRMAETWEDLAHEVERANNRPLWDLLKATYDRVTREPLPDVVQQLLKQLDTPRRR